MGILEGRVYQMNERYGDQLREGIIAKWCHRQCNEKSLRRKELGQQRMQIRLGYMI